MHAALSEFVVSMATNTSVLLMLKNHFGAGSYIKRQYSCTFSTLNVGNVIIFT